jgi:hypothetical protein
VISAEISYFDLLFCANLLHTASAVPGYLLPDSDTMAIRLKDLAHHLNLSVSTISGADR